MMPEAQALLHEFTRRLRQALSHAPNHVRMEAVLEVESHVRDVLSRHRGTVDEMERVAEILAGFGTPEAYAQALMTQVPAAAAVTVHAGAREVFTAVRDLLTGAWRLGAALLRQLFAWALLTLRQLFRLLRWSFRQVQAGWRWSRGPAGQAGALARMGAQRTGRGVTLLRLWLAGRAHAVGRLARWSWNLATGGARLLGRIARWSLRAVGTVLLIGLTLSALGLAAFAALAPDIVGWAMHTFRYEVGQALEQLREETIYRFTPGVQSDYAHAGHVVLVGALSAGLLLVGLIVWRVWSARRRRNSLAQH